jgi:hypothetical protein
MYVQNVGRKTLDCAREFPHVGFRRRVQVAHILDLIGNRITKNGNAFMQVGCGFVGGCEDQHCITAAGLHTRQIADIHFRPADCLWEVTKGHMDNSKHV